jgi:two-component system NarL family sensor kinase
LNKTIPLAEQCGDPEKLAHYYAQLATILMNNAQFNKAEIYNQKAIDLLKDRFPASTTLLLAYLSATSTYIYDSMNEEAKKNLDKAREMLAPFPGSINYPDYYYNEGLYYTGINQFDKALISLDKGIVLAEQYHQGPLLQILLFRKYTIFIEQKDYKKAKQFLMGLVKNGSLAAEANNRRTLYTELARTNEYLGNMKEAYHWSARYSQLSDSLHGIQLKEKIAGLETKFRNSENQKEISRLQEEKARIALSASNSRLFNWLLGTACLLLLVTAVFSWSFIRNQKKLQQLKVTRAMLEGEERERKRIAQDLHDGLGGMLSSVKINLSGWVAGNLESPKDQGLQKIIDQLDGSVGELRHIARNMMPETLLKFGLETALKDLCEFYMRAGLHIEFQSFNIHTSLPLPWQINIYRIVQEVLSNAIRHANATNIILQCSQNEPVFFITIEDNGKGFDQAESVNKNGLGLLNVKSRVDYMKGKMAISSAAGEGTVINIELSTYAE